MLRPLPPQPPRRPLLWAVLLSLLVHGLVLFVSRPTKELPVPPAPRLSARLQPAPQLPPSEPSPALQSAPQIGQTSKPPVLTADNRRRTTRQTTPRWSAAEKAEMDRFLDELATTSKRRQPPTLQERAMAMARQAGQDMAKQDDDKRTLLELKPNAKPPDPFSLSLYLDGLIRKLNRSAAMVRNDPRNQGRRPAAVIFKINPDGTLRNFEVLNAGDQEGQIAYIKAVVERAAPFAAFPPEIDKAARSLTMTICIQPNAQGDGMGFRRLDSKSC